MALTGNLFMIIVGAVLALSAYSRNSVRINELTIWNDVVKKFHLLARGHYTLK